MGETTKIEWTGATWNPWYGCLKVSHGCDNCYMYRDMERYGRNPSVVTRSKTQFNMPLKLKEPTLIFTCSWSDFFIREADEWRAEAWEIMRQTPQHTYQVLTKRPGRAVAWYKAHGWLPNVWIGTSVESAKYLPRLDVLARITAAPVRFVSAEPLLGPLYSLMRFMSGNPGDLDWVIAGGESGSNRRHYDDAWAKSIQTQCQVAGVPFFYKQGSGPKPGMNAVLDGREWREMPPVNRE